MDRKMRVLVAKVGCDIHERGALTMLSCFRDAGMEAIYTGRFQSEEGVVNAAIMENVDCICVSDLTGSLVIIYRKILDYLRQNGAESIQLVCGGIVTEQDAVELKEMGVAASFGTGFPPEESVRRIQEIIRGRWEAEAHDR